MTTKRTSKALRVATSVEHQFRHDCKSGNRVHLRAVIPPPGNKTEFDVLWNRTPTRADQREKRIWLADVAAKASEIARRSLTVRTFDERGEPLEFSAAKMEAAP